MRSCDTSRVSSETAPPATSRHVVSLTALEFLTVLESAQSDERDAREREAAALRQVLTDFGHSLPGQPLHALDEALERLSVELAWRARDTGGHCAECVRERRASLKSAAWLLAQVRADVARATAAHRAAGVAR